MLTSLIFAGFYPGLTLLAGQTEAPPRISTPGQSTISQTGPTGQALASLAADCPSSLVLAGAQEFVFRGTFQEEFLSSQVQHGRSWRVESRNLILAEGRGFKVASFTQVRPKEIRIPGSNPKDTTPRIEEAGSPASHVVVAKVTPNGQYLTEERQSRPVGLEGIPLRDITLFVGLPLDSTQAADGWKSQEVGRPDWNWKLVGREGVQGARCVVIEGTQTPPEWDKPRADRQAWRRKARAWISTTTGLVHRLEKSYERRDAARDYVSLRTTFRMELDSTLGYPGQLFEDRKREVLMAFQTQEETLSQVDEATRNPRAYDALVRQINTQISDHPSTPYRAALMGVLRKIDLAKKGELAPATQEEAAGSEMIAGPAVGRIAPDFLVPSMDKGGTLSLRNWKNKPILLLFYHPDSPSAISSLAFANELARDTKGKIQVLGLSTLGDVRRVSSQKEAIKLTFPIVDGSGLKISYALDSTPKWYLVDSQGIIRSIQSGWGDEMKADLLREAQGLLSAR